MTLLENIPAGSRFQAIEAPAITGTLVKVNEGSATVVLDGRDKLRDFQDGSTGEWVRFTESGSKRTTITKALNVRVIN